MLHGMIYAKQHKDLNKDPGNDFRNEVRSYFGTGTQLQEMYITPSLLTDAELGRPGRGGEVVARQCRRVEGHALDRRRSGVARSVRMGIMDAAQRDSGAAQSERSRADDSACELQDAFELPPGAAQGVQCPEPWKDDAGAAARLCFTRKRHMSSTSLRFRYSRSTSCRLGVHATE